MAIVINFAGASILKAGSYSRTLVASGGAASAQLGIVALIGEATSGPAFVTGDLAASTYTPAQFQAIADTYGSGELVDMAKLVLAPSADPQISGGAQQLVIVKTNPGNTASILVNPAFAFYTGTIAGASTPVTLTAVTPGTAGNSINLTFTGTNTINSEIATWNGANPTNQVALTSGSGTQTPTALANAQLSGGNQYGTIFAADPGLEGNGVYASIAIVGGQAVFTLANPSLGITQVSDPIGGNVDMTLLCTDGSASAATVTITATTLTTTITGGTTSNLNIQLSQYTDIANLVDYINTIPGYTATAPNAINAVQPPSVMDQVTAQSIKTTPYSIVQDVYDVEQFFATATLATFTATAVAGLPTAMTKAYLSGGTLGGTSAAQVQAAIDALQGVRVNFIIPCFSQDATKDILTGFTDPSSTYTIAAIIAGLRSHVAQMSTVTGKKECQGFVGYRDTFANQQTASATYNYPRIQMSIQEPNVLTAAGTTAYKQPHAMAVISAGMKAAAVIGLPNTFKQPNILAFRSPFGDFDPETQGDAALASNLFYVEKAPAGGFRFQIDNTTYASQLDAWFYNRSSVIYAADVAAFTIRLNTELFVGQRNSDISPETVKNFLVKVMDSLRASGIIVGDVASGGKGYTVLNVRIVGSIVYVDVTLVLVEGIEYALNTITVQRAQS